MGSQKFPQRAPVKITRASFRNIRWLQPVVRISKLPSHILKELRNTGSDHNSKASIRKILHRQAKISSQKPPQPLEVIPARTESASFTETERSSSPLQGFDGPQPTNCL